jgi:hypothetical protein
MHLIEEARGVGEFDMAEGGPGPVGSPKQVVVSTKSRIISRTVRFLHLQKARAFR